MDILVTGASGQLGAYLIDAIRARGHRPIAWSGREPGHRSGMELVPVDLRDPDATEAALDRDDPAAIIHAAALSAAEAVRRDPATARAVNVEATARIAAWCGRRGRRLVFSSTDLVFDGSRSFHREIDPADPVLAYGRTKLQAETDVLAIASSVVARLPLLFGPSRCGRPYFFTEVVDAIARGEPRSFFVDEYRTPIDLATAASTLVRLIESDFNGLVHVAGAERVSRFDLMRRSAVALGLDPALVRGNRRADVELPEPRPADVSLDTARLLEVLPDLRRPSIEEASRA